MQRLLAKHSLTTCSHTWFPSWCTSFPSTAPAAPNGTAAASSTGLADVSAVRPSHHATVPHPATSAAGANHFWKSPGEEGSERTRESSLKDTVEKQVFSDSSRSRVFHGCVSGRLFVKQKASGMCLGIENGIQPPCGSGGQVLSSMSTRACSNVIDQRVLVYSRHSRTQQDCSLPEQQWHISKAALPGNHMRKG